MRRLLVRSFRVSKHLTTSEEELKAALLKEKTYYELLEVPSTASPQTIRHAYLRLTRVLHPDLTGQPSDEFSSITRAYQTLSDPHQRVIYDESLVPDQHYYTVGVGKWRVKLTHLLGTSILAILGGLALGENTNTEENCPTSFKLRKTGASEDLPIVEKPAEDKEIRWAKVKSSSKPLSLPSDSAKTGIFQGKTDSPEATQSKDTVSTVKLPKTRSFSLDSNSKDKS